MVCNICESIENPKSLLICKGYGLIRFHIGLSLIDLTFPTMASIDTSDANLVFMALAWNLLWKKCLPVIGIAMRVSPTTLAKLHRRRPFPKSRRRGSSLPRHHPVLARNRTAEVTVVPQPSMIRRNTCPIAFSANIVTNTAFRALAKKCRRVRI